MRIEPNNPSPQRNLEILGVKRILEVPTAIAQEHEAFVLFLAIDAGAVSDDDLRRVAQELLARGLAYVCVWGNDCSRVHDQFDLERDNKEVDGMTVMTTWHADETLEEALEFFRDCAWPDDGSLGKTWCRIAISVGSDAWRNAIERFLAA